MFQHSSGGGCSFHTFQRDAALQLSNWLFSSTGPTCHRQLHIQANSTLALLTVTGSLWRRTMGVCTIVIISLCLALWKPWYSSWSLLWTITLTWVYTAFILSYDNYCNLSLHSKCQIWLTLEIFLFQRSYIFTFLLSSRLFLHPFELMSRVCYLCVDHHRVGDPQTDKVCAVILGVDSMTKMLYHHMSIFTSQYSYIGWKRNSDVLHNHVVMSGFGQSSELNKLHKWKVLDGREPKDKTIHNKWISLASVQKQLHIM